MSATAERLPTEPFAHPALYYRGTAEYLGGIIPFVLAGLRADEPVAVVVPAANLALVRAELGRSAERVHLLDMTEAGRNPGRIIPGVLRAFADPFPDRHVRIVGEPVWPERSPAEYAACVQHEALVNAAFANRWVTIMCPYDAVRLSPTALADAARTHPMVMHARIDPGERPRGRNWGFAPEQMLATYRLPVLVAPPDAQIRTIRSAQELAGLRRTVEEYAAGLGFAEPRRYDIALVATELATNSLEHGGGCAEVRLFVEPDQLVCQVSDRGQLLDPLAGRRLPEPGQQRGRGLLMVNQIADLVQLHTDTDGTTVTTMFRRP